MVLQGGGIVIRKRNGPDHENDMEKQLVSNIDSNTSCMIRIKKLIILEVSLHYL